MKSPFLLLPAFLVEAVFIGPYLLALFHSISFMRILCG